MGDPGGEDVWDMGWAEFEKAETRLDELAQEVRRQCKAAAAAAPIQVPFLLRRPQCCRGICRRRSSATPAKSSPATPTASRKRRQLGHSSLEEGRWRRRVVEWPKEEHAAALSSLAASLEAGVAAREDAANRQAAELRWASVLLFAESAEGGWRGEVDLEAMLAEGRSEEEAAHGPLFARVDALKVPVSVFLFLAISRLLKMESEASFAEARLAASHLVQTQILTKYTQFIRPDSRMGDGTGSGSGGWSGQSRWRWPLDCDNCLRLSESLQTSPKPVVL